MCLLLDLFSAMLASAEYVLADVDLVAPYVFKMRKLKWLHVTSPIAKNIIVEWEKRKTDQSKEYKEQKTNVEEKIQLIEDEISQLQYQYRDSMTQTPPSIDAARKAVQALTDRYIKDINLTLLEPHESVRQCLEAIIIILKQKTHLYSEKQPSSSRGYDISWNEICKITKQPDFISKLQNFDNFTEISEKFLLDIREHHMKKLKRRTYQIQLHASPASEMLYQWLDIVVRFASLMVMREPLPMQIREAMSRLNKARLQKQVLEDEVHGLSRPRFVLTRSAGFFSTLVGEFVLSHILKRERGVEMVKKKERPLLRGLNSCTVGILGFGEAGQEVARVCSLVSINVCALVRQPQEPGKAASTVSEYVTIRELSSLLRQSDYIVNLLPSTKSTAGLLCGTVLASCKAQTVFLNFGSSDIIDMETLKMCISERWLSEAVYDSMTTGLSEDDLIAQISGVSVIRHIDLLDHAEGIGASFASTVEDCFTNGLAQPDHVVKFNRGY